MARLFQYELEGNGWAVSTITVDGLCIKLDASYVHDTFANVVEALIAKFDGTESVEWVYFHEPLSTHVRLKNTSANVHMSLWEFSDLRVPRPTLGEAGRLIAQGEIELNKIMGDVIISGSRMLEKHGDDGYEKAWRRRFPTEGLEKLKQVRRDLGRVVS